MKCKSKKIILSLSSSFFLVNSLYSKDINELDKFIVTAQKVEQNSQEIPLSISLFDEFEIVDKNIKSVKDIAYYVPNLMMFSQSDAGFLVPNMRGLSSLYTNLSTSVGMFIDGIPILNAAGFDATLMDIERIEVLKGPQGTLYGKDTQAGAINIITKKPNNETKAKIGAEFGSDNKKEYSFGVSGPIIKDKLYIGLSGKHYEKDGFIQNTYKNENSDYRKNNYGKINFRYAPMDNLDISLISSKLKKDDGSYKTNKISAISKTVTNNGDVWNKSENILNSLKIEYELNNYKLESITSSKEYKDIASCDNDFSSNTLFHTLKNNSFKNNAQEFKLSSQNNSFNWLLGLYIDKDKNSYDFNMQRYISRFNTVVPMKMNYTSNGKSLGFFGHTTYNINNKLTINAGIRYDKDTKYFKYDAINIDTSESYNSISPKFALDYKLNKNSMIYTNIAKGYKSGGYYAFAPTGYDRNYDKEELWSYEIGIKNRLLENKLLLNIASYYMDISNMQVVTPINNMDSYMSNAASATSKGLEIEANYKFTDEIELFTSFGFNQTKYDKFQDKDGDYSGNYNPYAPKYNYNIGLQYRDKNGYFTRIDLNAYGKMFLDKTNNYKRDTYEIVNIKFGYETNNYELYVYSKNLFDKEYNAIGTSNGQYVSYSEPREVGIQLAYRF